MLLVPLAEGLNAELGDVLPGIQGVVYGIAIIMIILWAPEGIYWRGVDRFLRPGPEGGGPETAAAPAAAPAAANVAPLPRAPAPSPLGADLLVLRDIGISFGG